MIGSLEEHPGMADVLAVLGQLTHIGDDQMRRLAALWRNDANVARARNAALSPDSPLVIEVLAAFDAISAVYAEDLFGEADYLTVPAGTTSLALKAVRDAVAGVYARPILTGGQYRLLVGPWNMVMTGASVDGPDLGPDGEKVKAVLRCTTGLSARCHDPAAARLFDHLAVLALTGENDRELARLDAFSAAIATARRHTWALVRRSVDEALNRPCRDCGFAARRDPCLDRDVDRVTALIADGACALLVSDTADPSPVRFLTGPLAVLVPGQRPVVG